MFKKFVEKNSDYFYLVFRVIIGIVFLLHGLMKMPGILAGTSPTMFVLAGIIETIAGPMIILGLCTRYIAVVTAIEMVVAYFTVHMPMGANPLTNKGEAAVLFFAAFLVLIAQGSRKWALDNLFKK